ncbi:MAG TPA: hypothetical protein VJ692_15925, partial [Nitrospiraceae bacterium]|nr:hypothetical protein [Nitrospiraceae bacterium]
MVEAQQYFQEAVDVRRKLWQAQPKSHGDQLATSLLRLAQSYAENGSDVSTVCAFIQEAEKVAI